MLDQMKDVSMLVQKILFCVRQTNEVFNKEVINDTLRGVKDKTLVRLDLHRLSSYGALSRYGKNQIEHLIQLLFDNGALREGTGRYKAIKLTPSAEGLLQQTEPIYTHLPRKNKK
jgi:superfamily II DNA helicase RecQ